MATAYVFNPFTGNLDVTDNIGSVISAFTTGSVPFAEAGSLAEDNANFFYDNTNNALGLGTNTGFDADDKLLVYPGIDIQATIGNTMIGYGGFPGLGLCIISHKNFNTVTGFALGQLADGSTFVNSAPGTSLNLSSGFTAIAQLLSGSFTIAGGNNLVLNGLTSGNTSIKSPAVAGTYTIELPSATSVADDVLLSTAGGGVLNFGKVPVASIATLTANRVVQTNSSGVLATPVTLQGGLVPFGNTSTGDFTAGASGIKYSVATGFGINKSNPVNAALDAHGADTTLPVGRFVGASGQSVDLVSIDTFGEIQVAGFDRLGLFMTARGTVGNATASIFGLNDPRDGMNIPGASVVELFTNATNNLRLTTTGTTVSKGVLDTPLGAVGAPSQTFTGDLNTGVWSPGADLLAVSTGGAERIRASSTGLRLTAGVFDTPLGAVGAPSNTFTGDLNTGMWSPGADLLALSTGGAERLRVSSTGVTVSSGVIDVPATTSTTVPLVTFTGDTNTGLGTPAADQLVLITGGSTRIRTNSTGTMIGSSTSPVGIFNIFSNSVEAFWLTGTVNTTDATQTTIITFTTASDISYHLEADVIARRTGGALGTAGDTAAYKVLGFVKNVAGTLTLSALTVSLAAEDQVLMDATFTISGTAIRVSVTGTVSNNFTWDCLWKLIRV